MDILNPYTQSGFPLLVIICGIAAVFIFAVYQLKRDRKDISPLPLRLIFYTLALYQFASFFEMHGSSTGRERVWFFLFLPLPQFAGVCLGIVGWWIASDFAARRGGNETFLIWLAVAAAASPVLLFLEMLL